MENEDKKTIEALKILEKALREFWKDNGKYFIANGRHTDVVIEPKFIVGHDVNPEVAKQVIMTYLSRITLEDILNEKVIITPDLIIIKDDAGQIIAEIKSRKIIDKTSNKIISRLGRELSRHERKKGGAYLEPKDDYTFGDIKTGLIEYFMDMEKHDSKNLLAEATLIFCREDGSLQELSSLPMTATSAVPINPFAKRRPLPFRPRFK